MFEAVLNGKYSFSIRIDQCMLIEESIDTQKTPTA